MSSDQQESRNVSPRKSELDTINAASLAEESSMDEMDGFDFDEGAG